MRRLTFQLGDAPGQELEVPDRCEVVIGRAEGTRGVALAPSEQGGWRVSAPLSTLSQEHALLRVGPEGVTVEDLGSRNGTYVQLAPGEPRALEARALFGSELAVQVGRPRWMLPERVPANTPEELLTFVRARLRGEGCDVRLEGEGGPSAGAGTRVALPVAGSDQRLVVEWPRGTTNLAAGRWLQELLNGFNVQTDRERGRPWEFTAASRARWETLRLAQKVAGSDATVLILGSTGIGKDVLAEDLHNHSLRASGPFVAVNCAAIPSELVESELFGHMGGAFTGASRTRTGLVEEADGGTLFLDEVGELPMDMQAKLLRFLERWRFRPVGSTREKTVSVRVIAATNRDLGARIPTAFREDLYYRLSAVTILVPPLQPEDVRSLVKVFAAHEASRSTRGPLPPAELDAVCELASRRSWKGNARELRNVVGRYFLFRSPSRSATENWDAALSSGAPPAPPAPPPSSHPSSNAPPPEDANSVPQYVRDLVFLSQAMRVDNVRALAERVQLTPQAVYPRLKKLGLGPDDVGHADRVSRAMDEIRSALGPSLPWLNALLGETR